MATRKKKTTKRAPARDHRITEEQHNEAVNTLRAEYYQGVRDIAEELIEDKSLKNRDDWETALHQAIDGSYWVIYTHANFQVLMCSDNHDAYSENYGQAPVEGDQVNWAAMAFAAMEQDVQQQLQAEGAGPPDEMSERRRTGSRVHETYFKIQIMNSDGTVRSHSVVDTSIGKQEAIKEAKELVKEIASSRSRRDPNGRYVRVVTNSGETVWDSRKHR